ncbi:uncharacterized protein F54H12.2 [Trichonephila inaurata madagascariensis]|uniref:Uncharacterized protein F54H12.2 n=1 Tax=Trichonephila inaurata madagascariensis TaxID=2747483 RepID=A0A8X6X5F9_9ARAC|nr:uncharacterized protein F54H12.2 [Trichonephila inaurata madagascariensis]
MIVCIHSDLFHQDRLLLNLVDLKIKLIRSKLEFCLQGSEGFKVVLDHVSLFIRKVRVNPEVILGHAKALEKTSAKYPIDRVLCKVYSIPKGSMSFIQDNIFSGQMPKKLFVVCVDNEAFHGAFSKFPYEFKHFNLNFIGVYVDGQPVPHNPLELDFSKDQYLRAYQTLFVGTDRIGQERVLSQEPPYFQGAYSRDTLPPLQENMCAIVNSDDSSQPGTHWLALFVNDKRELEFYDSFGQPPVFYNISTTTYLDVLWCVFQSPTSNVCGQYSIYFLFKRSQGYSMHYILNQLYINDFQMYQFVKKRYGVRFVIRK